MIPSIVLSFITCVVLLPLSHSEHTKSIRPSNLICLFLVFSVLFDAVQVRTLWLIHGTPQISTVFSTSLAIKLALLVLESANKVRFLHDEDVRGRTPEDSSGIFSRSLFLWLNTLIYNGYKKALSMNDLYPIPDDFSSELLEAELWKNWETSKAFSLSSCIQHIIEKLTNPQSYKGPKTPTTPCHRYRIERPPLVTRPSPIMPNWLYHLPPAFFISIHCLSQ